MNFQQFEYKYGKFAIPNLNNIIVCFYAAGLLIQFFDPFLYLRYLSFNTQAVLKGEVWRIITFLFYPPAGASRSMMSVILSALIIYVYYNLSTILLRYWSEFKFTLYMLIGILGHIIGGLLYTLITKEPIIMTPGYLSFSIFIAFALTFPDTQFLFMFLVPIKAIYLAYVEIALFIISFLGAPVADKICIIVSLLNVLLLIYFYNKNTFRRFFNFKNKFRKY